MAPHSHGSVQLRSAGPQTGPRLDPNYLSDPRDIDALVAGLDLARAIGRAKALEPWRSAEVHPGPDARNGDSLRAYLRTALQSYHHPVGTCRIGEDDSGRARHRAARTRNQRTTRRRRLRDAVHRLRQHDGERLWHRRTSGISHAAIR